MRSLAITLGFLALLAPQTSRAQERGIIVLSPGLTSTAGLREFAEAFTHETGIKVTVQGAGMGVIVETALTADPPVDLVLLPIAEMDQLAQGGGFVAATRQPFGRVGIGLALRRGAPKPDISTPEKAIAALRAGGRVAYTDPKGGSAQAALIARMLARPELTGVNAIPFIGHAGGAQAAGAVARGEADIGLQPVGETMSFRPELDTAGPLPTELGLYIDMEAAVSARARQPAEAAEFLRYMTQPGAFALWFSKGLTLARR
jgi:molybdate transport system substrate-binding protein